MPTETSKQRDIYLFFLGFTFLWIIYVLFLKSYNLSSVSLMDALRGIGIRIVLWILPVVVYLNWKREHIWKSLGLDHFSRKSFLWLVIGSAITFGLFAARQLLINQPIQFDFDKTHYTWLSAIIFVPFVEEIVFRGLIFNQLLKFQKPLVAAVISNILFIWIHLPGWLILGGFSWFNCLAVFVTGVLLSWVFYQGKSLYPAIFVHGLNNFLATG